MLGDDSRARAREVIRLMTEDMFWFWVEHIFYFRAGAP